MTEGAWRVDGTVEILSRARPAAEDRPPGRFGSRERASRTYMWMGLATLRDLSTEDPAALFAVLDRLDRDTLRWALAQAARELHEAGWRYPGEEDNGGDDGDEWSDAGEVSS
jgi:hypothetical protein